MQISQYIPSSQPMVIKFHDGDQPKHACWWPSRAGYQYIPTHAIFRTDQAGHPVHILDENQSTFKDMLRNYGIPFLFSHTIVLNNSFNN